MRVVVVACDDDGNVDLDDLRAKIDEHADRLAALMVTYPSTHGVFEEAIGDICAAVHDAGGQVYLDGANLNALVGLARPGQFGADVSHLNLHKTFCIPHGGGGPGVGPVAVRRPPRAVPAQPPAGARVRAGRPGVGPISAAPWGSAGILPIPWAYIRLMGAEGLRGPPRWPSSTPTTSPAGSADHYPVLYTGRSGLVAHECILDLRPLTKATGITVDDVAKRLIDYGFHAPTMSFPVAGTLMVEPTETEDLAELDRFCDAMIAIRAEVDECPEVLAGNAPHTARVPSSPRTGRSPYSREQAAFPVPGAQARSTGRRSAASTAPPATATSSAPAPRSRPTPDELRLVERRRTCELSTTWRRRRGRHDPARTGAADVDGEPSPSSTSGGRNARAMPWPSIGREVAARDLADRLAVDEHRLVARGAAGGPRWRCRGAGGPTPALLLGRQGVAAPEVALVPAHHPAEAGLQRRDARAQLVAVQRQAGLEPQRVAGAEPGGLDAGAEHGVPQPPARVGRARRSRRRPRRCSRCRRRRRRTPSHSSRRDPEPGHGGGLGEHRAPAARGPPGPARRGSARVDGDVGLLAHPERVAHPRRCSTRWA